MTIEATRATQGDPATSSFGNPSEVSPHVVNAWSMHDISVFIFYQGGNLPFFCAEAMLLPRVYLATN